MRKIRKLYNKKVEQSLQYLKQQLYKVRVTLAGPQTIGKNDAGECYKNEGRIKIRINTTARSKKKVLLHEILEAIAIILYRANKTTDVNKNITIEIFDHAVIDKTVEKILK